MHKKMSLRERIKSYKLGTQVTIAFILFFVFVVSVLVYQIEPIRKNDVWANLILALFTSVLVSVITLIVDIIVEFNRHKNDAYLESLREFGIGNLYLDKEAVLRELFDECDRKIWISGYRLILTNKLKNDIYSAVKRGADFYAVICPPWTDAFKMVYGSNEKVLDNYLQVFNAVNKVFARIHNLRDFFFNAHNSVLISVNDGHFNLFTVSVYDDFDRSLGVCN